MSTPIQFYFDYSSPYGYFAAMRIDELAAKYGRQVEWHPILLGVIFKTTETKPLMHIPLKGEYSKHDLLRTARFHQIDFVIPANFPVATQQAARATLWVQNTCGKDKAKQFAKKLFQTFFADGVDISEVPPILKAAEDEGLDSLELANGMIQQEIKDQLKEEIEHALKLGIFGSPYIIIDGEPFWGFDRFDQIEALLKNGKI